MCNDFTVSLNVRLKTEVDGWANKVQFVSNKHTEQMASLKREIFERSDEVILLKSKLKKESEVNYRFKTILFSFNKALFEETLAMIYNVVD